MAPCQEHFCICPHAINPWRTCFITCFLHTLCVGCMSFTFLDIAQASHTERQRRPSNVKRPTSFFPPSAVSMPSLHPASVPQISMSPYLFLGGTSMYESSYRMSQDFYRRIGTRTKASCTNISVIYLYLQRPNTGNRTWQGCIK